MYSKLQLALRFIRQSLQIRQLSVEGGVAMTAYWYIALVVAVFSLGFISGAAWAAGTRGEIGNREVKLEETDVSGEEAHPVCR